MKRRPQPTLYACEIVANGLKEALRLKSWDLVEHYQQAIERMSKGAPAFVAAKRLSEEMDARRERIATLNHEAGANYGGEG